MVQLILYQFAIAECKGWAGISGEEIRKLRLQINAYPRKGMGWLHLLLDLYFLVPGLCWMFKGYYDSFLVIFL